MRRAIITRPCFSYVEACVSRSIAATTAIVLLSGTGDEAVKNVVVMTLWEKSLLQRIGFRRRAVTTSKIEIPDSAKKQVFNIIITSQV